MSLIKSNKRRSPMLRSSIFGDDPFFNDFWNSRRGGMDLNNLFNTRSESDLEIRPAMNVRDNKTEYEIELAVPGLNKEDFNITLEDGILNISAEKEEESEEKKEGMMRREFSYNSFSRSMALPDNVDENQEVKAHYKDGILKLMLHKKEESQPKLAKTVKVS